MSESLVNKRVIICSVDHPDGAAAETAVYTERDYDYSLESWQLLERLQRLYPNCELRIEEIKE